MPRGLGQGLSGDDGDALYSARHWSDADPRRGRDILTCELHAERSSTPNEPLYPPSFLEPGYFSPLADPHRTNALPDAPSRSLYGFTGGEYGVSLEHFGQAHSDEKAHDHSRSKRSRVDLDKRDPLYAYSAEDSPNTSDYDLSGDADLHYHPHRRHPLYAYSLREVIEGFDSMDMHADYEHRRPPMPLYHSERIDKARRFDRSRVRRDREHDPLCTLFRRPVDFSRNAPDGGQDERSVVDGNDEADRPLRALYPSERAYGDEQTGEGFESDAFREEHRHSIGSCALYSRRPGRYADSWADTEFNPVFDSAADGSPQLHQVRMRAASSHGFKWLRDRMGFRQRVLAPRLEDGDCRPLYEYTTDIDAYNRGVPRLSEHKDCEIIFRRSRASLF